MTYKKIDALDHKWTIFAQSIKNDIDPFEYHLAELQKLMTAKSVVDLGTHAIYSHTQYLHKLSSQLLNLKHSSLRAFTELLKARNESPLKIKHHRRMAGFCSFDFTLQRLQGEEYGFSRIELLDQTNTEEFNLVLTKMKEFDCLSHGVNFGALPIMGDTVLSAMIKYKDCLCFVARDKNEQIIAYAFGLFLRDVPCEASKGNVFLICNLVKHPDFYDPSLKIGSVLRDFIATTLKQRTDCHFVSYQHDLSHKFHTSIVEGHLSEDEAIKLGDEKYQTKSYVEYDITLHRSNRLIKVNTHELAFPNKEDVESAFFATLWKAANSGTDFVFGALALYGQIFYKLWTNSLLEKPIESRLVEPVSLAQQRSDKATLKTILQSTLWDKQGSILFFNHHTPNTIQKIRPLVELEDYDFSRLKQIVSESRWAFTRSKLTSYLYFAITQSTSPTQVLNLFIAAEDTPKEWITLIDEERQRTYNQDDRLIQTQTI